MPEIHELAPEGFVSRPLDYNPASMDGIEGLDSYPVHLDPTHIPFVLDNIAKTYSGEELYLFTNCVSQIEIDGVVIGRQYDTLLASKAADMVIQISRDSEFVNAAALYNGLVERGIPVTTINGKVPNDDFVDDDNIRGFFPVRDLDVLKEAVDLAKTEGRKEADIYPNAPWTFKVGYRHETAPETFEFVPVYEIGGTGVVDTGHFSLIMDNGSSKNLKPQDLQNTVYDLGLTTNVYDSGHPPYVTQDKSEQYKLGK